MDFGSQQRVPSPRWPYLGALGQDQVNDNILIATTQQLAFPERPLCATFYTAPMLSQKLEEIGQLGGALLFFPLALKKYLSFV